jgi:hypothetical protein
MQFVPGNPPFLYILSLDTTKMANDKSSNPHEFKPFIYYSRTIFLALPKI